MVALLSKLWCKAQLEHTDFTQSVLAKVLSKVLSPQHDDQMPLACLAALMGGTPFDLWPGGIRPDPSRKIKPMQIRLNAGDVLIFRGDLVHAGAAVGDVENVRAYMDPEGFVRPKHDNGEEQTYSMNDKDYIMKRQK
jgi:hypothetical protein